MNLGDWESIATIAAAILSLLAAVAGYIEWRKSELRREEVHAWANDGIDALQSLVLTITITLPGWDGQRADKLTELGFRTSILVEQGRLFFKNNTRSKYKMNKEVAYRGIRPIILDQLLIGHRISLAWPASDTEDQRLMREVATECLKRFVSLAQQEVGRRRTASLYSARDGNRSDLQAILERKRQAELSQPRQ